MFYAFCVLYKKSLSISTSQRCPSTFSSSPSYFSSYVLVSDPFQGNFCEGYEEQLRLVFTPACMCMFNCYSTICYIANPSLH